MRGQRKKRSNGRKSRARGGFSFFVTMAQIREWLAMPLEHRLMWLEEANRFNSMAVRGAALKVMEDLRAGRI